MKRKIAYQDLVQGATDIMLYAGYYRTSVAKVMMTAELGKGSFQNYFYSKSEMGMAVIDNFTNQLLSWQKEAFNKAELQPWDRIHLYFSSLCEHFEKVTHYKGGCMVGNLGIELGDISMTVNKRLNNFVQHFNHNTATLLAEGQQTGTILNTMTAADMAELILITWEGSVWRMKLTADRAPLDLFLNQFLPTIKITNHHYRS